MHAYGIAPARPQGLLAHFDAVSHDWFDEAHVVLRSAFARASIVSRAVRRTPKQQSAFDEKSSRSAPHVRSLALPILSIAP
jgi:hypothetical protein